MSGMEKCLRESPIGEAPKWTMNTRGAGGRHENDLVWSTLTSEDAKVTPVKWMRTRVGSYGTNFESNKEVVVGCVDKNNRYLKMVFYRNFAMAPQNSDNHKKFCENEAIEYKNFTNEM
jgi:hypothetical protein